MTDKFIIIFEDVLNKLSSSERDFSNEENVKAFAKKMYDAGFEVGFYSNN